MSETPKAAELSARYPTAPLGLLFAVQDLERENALLAAANSDVRRIALERDRLLVAAQRVRETCPADPDTTEDFEAAWSALCQTIDALKSFKS